MIKGSTISKRLNDFNKRFDDFDRKINDLDKKVEQRLNDFSKILTIHDKRIDDLAKRVESLEGQVAELRREVSSIKTDIINLLAQILRERIGQ